MIIGHLPLTQEIGKLVPLELACGDNCVENQHGHRVWHSRPIAALIEVEAAVMIRD
jgi:hypothetical protein